MKWLALERSLRVRVGTVGVLSDDIRIAIVRRPAPELLRQHLRLRAAEYEGRCNSVREIIEGSYRSGDPGQEGQVGVEIGSLGKWRKDWAKAVEASPKVEEVAV